MLNDDDITQINTLISQKLGFTNSLYGDTPTDALQLTPKKYVDAQVTSVYSAISSVTGVPAVFGDGSDGTITLNGSNNYAAASIIATNTYAQTRDIYSTILTINNGVTLQPKQYRIFASSVFHALSASIVSKGNAASVFTGGASILAGYFPSIAAGIGGGGAGPGGNNSGGGTGGDGGIGAPVTHSFGQNGVASRSGTAILGGGANGLQGGPGGNSGNAGGATAYINRPIPLWGVQTMMDMDSNGIFSRMTGSAGSGGGPGGGGGASGGTGQIGAVGGSGGGAGSNGGIVAIYAKSLQLDSGSVIDIQGGAGGNGANGANASVQGLVQLGGGAGGNGGSGGNGGYVILMYNSLQQKGSILTAGGTFGTGGTGGAAANGGGGGGNGVAGFAGNAGSVMSFQITG